MRAGFGRIEWLGLTLLAAAGCSRYRCPVQLPVELAGPARTAVATVGGDSVDYTLGQPAVDCFPGEWPRVRTERVERAWRDQLYVVASVAVGAGAAEGAARPVARIVAIAADGSEVAAAETEVLVPASAGNGQIRAVLELPEEQVKRIRTIRIGWVEPGSG